jgi:hypothetical protein
MKKDGIGCWGGRTETSGDRRRIIDALVIPEVEFNPHKGCDVKCFKEDANKLIPNKIHISEPELDLIYVTVLTTSTRTARITECSTL